MNIVKRINHGLIWLPVLGIGWLLPQADELSITVTVANSCYQGTALGLLIAYIITCVA